MFMTIWVSFMYSGGLPIIYLVCVINFGIGYWVYKSLLVHYNKRTYEFDEAFIRWTLNFFRVAVILHLFTSLLMFTNHSTLGTSRYEEDSNERMYQKLVDYLGEDTNLLKYSLVM